MLYYFNPYVAKLVGSDAATMFSHIQYWVDHNRKKGINLVNGKYWTYSTNKEWQETFIYMSEQKIKTCIEKLKNAGLIEIGHYNEDKWKKNTWFTTTEYGDSFVEYQPDEKLKTTDREAENKDSYNNNYNNKESTDNDKDNNTDEKEKKESMMALATMVIEYLNAKRGTRYTVKAKGSYNNIKDRVEDCEATYDDFVKVIDTKYEEWHNNETMEKYLRPSTLFGNKFINYLNEATVSSAHEERFESYRSDRE